MVSVPRTWLPEPPNAALKGTGNDSIGICVDNGSGNACLRGSLGMYVAGMMRSEDRTPRLLYTPWAWASRRWFAPVEAVGGWGGCLSRLNGVSRA